MNDIETGPRPHIWTSVEYYRMRELGWFNNQKVELIAGEVVVHPGSEELPPWPDMLPTRRWTKEEFYQMLELGWFQDQRVELIDGEVIDMPAQLYRHAIAIKLTDTALNVAFGSNFWVRTQLTLDLSPYMVPDPDHAVVPGQPRDYLVLGTPTTALLVVEVSESTLGFDRNRKGSIYAQAGIADYWIVNLVQRQLEVYRNPIADPSIPFGFRYADRIILDPGDVIAPLAAPNANVAVADLLP